MTIKTTIRISGTSRQGIVETTYDRLVEVFGEPTDHYLDKVSVQWAMEIDGVIVTIYDYHYDMPPVTPGHDMVYYWHIGGNDQRAVEAVLKALKLPDAPYVRGFAV